MKVSELMTRDVATCKTNHSLACSAQIMWDCDCGCVPIVDEQNHVVGMLTDRDVCMAALTRGKWLADIAVDGVASRRVISVPADASLETAEALMQRHQIRRLPVVDRDGTLQGVISMNDIARHMERTTSQPTGLSGDHIAQTLAAISRPHGTQKEARP